uniref:Uncharacterized protein n=1 Tax=Aegilops tauschii TaxID=37682 RepID=M8AXY0_AEGTA
MVAVKVMHLGSSGATRLGWATNKADIQTPVGCDSFGFSYRSVDGSKVYKAWRDKYADEGYGEGDILGFYISLPQGELYEPKQPDLVKYKGMPFHAQGLKDEKKTPDPVPGRYYPAASMYSLPDEPNCEVRFNFGPDFTFFPEDFAGRPVPRPMSEVPYQAYELKNEGPAENGNAEKAAGGLRRMEGVAADEPASASSSTLPSPVHCTMTIGEAHARYMDMVREEREEQFREVQADAAYNHQLPQEHLQVEEQLAGRAIAPDEDLAEQAALLD